MSLSKCEVRKLSANIRTSAVVVVRLLLYNRTTHYHSERGRSAETISAPRSVPLHTHPNPAACSAAAAQLIRLLFVLLVSVALLMARGRSENSR
jgi:hypothetical protein